MDGAGEGMTASAGGEEGEEGDGEEEDGEATAKGAGTEGIEQEIGNLRD